MGYSSEEEVWSVYLASPRVERKKWVINFYLLGGFYVRYSEFSQMFSQQEFSLFRFALVKIHLLSVLFCMESGEISSYVNIYCSLLSLYLGVTLES